MKISADLFDEWYESYKDDQGLAIAVGLDAFDFEVVPKAKAKAWFNRRLEQVSRKLKTAKVRDGLVIYRVMKVKEGWVNDLKDGKVKAIGANWTIDKELVPYLCNGFGNKMDSDHVILEAKISYDDFNHTNLFQPSYADDYEEFEVNPNDTVRLMRVWNGDMTKILAEFKKPIIKRCL